VAETSRRAGILEESGDYEGEWSQQVVGSRLRCDIVAGSTKAGRQNCEGGLCKSWGERLGLGGDADLGERRESVLVSWAV
jgi:hypothetical protein